ncbi:MAG: hypothetical protein ABIG84_07350 [archaeon]
MKFKLFGRFAKKGSPAPSDKKERKDAHRVINELTAKGLPESEIIRTLKDEGYSFKEIDDALNQSVRNEVVGGPQMDAGYGGPGQQFAQAQDMGNAQGYQEQYLDQDLRNMDSQDLDLSRRPTQLTDSTNIAPERGGMDNVSMPEDAGGQQQQMEADARENVYEVVESVVNERVNSLKVEIKEINAQIKSIQQIISEFKSEVHGQQDERRKEAGLIHEKIKENTTKIIDMEPRVAGLERAFKDIVPNLVDSVREIKEIATDKFGAGDIEEEDRRDGRAHKDNLFSESHENKKEVHDSRNMFDEPVIDEGHHAKSATVKKASAHDDVDPFDDSDDDEKV